MSAADTGQPDFVRLRHAPRNPGPFIHLRFGEAICKCCGQRKTRKGGSNVGGRFYCIDCKDKS